MRNDAHIPAIGRGTGSGIQPVFVAVTVPAFSYVNDNAIPSILAEYAMGNTVAMSIRRPMPSAVQRATSFALAVRCQNEEDATVRYVLHRPAGFYGLLYPDYAGQQLTAGAVFEVWSIVGITPAAAAEFTFYTGPFTFQPATPYILGLITPTTVTLSPTEFDVTTTGPTNPFADSAMLAEG